MKAVKAGIAIYDILSSDAALTGIVGNRIFPVIAQNETEFPFIAYMRSRVDTVYTKDGSCGGTVSVEMVCVSDDYGQSVEIAERVLMILDGKRFAQHEIRIIRLEDSFEDYVDDAFVQTMRFLISI